MGVDPFSVETSNVYCKAAFEGNPQMFNRHCGVACLA